ncbi:MAG: hypothetical protein HYY33_09685 [Chloroflexi bacterium]|nr:hypothetical protein [Chloroflexota bacterium]
MKVTIVVPTIREKNIQEFLDAWQDEFAMAEIIIVEDNPSRTFDLKGHSNIAHYSWEDIDRELGESSWIIPRRTDCVRSYGYYKAYQTRPDMLVTLDDDCYPMEPGGKGFLSRHWECLQGNGSAEAWRETGEGVVTRGVPYYNRARQRPVVLNHGLWNRIPDYDAPTQLLQSRQPGEFRFTNQTIPVGMYFPMCGMNVALRPEAIPAFYFMLMGRDYAYDRFGDIWAGVLVKKICDHLGKAVRSGDPAVAHQRASNVWANLRKEAPGLEVNETFWQAVDGVVLTGSTFGACYKEVTDKAELEGEYWIKLRRAMRVWAELFD